MYSFEQRKQAIELYNKYGLMVAQVAFMRHQR